MQVGEGFINKNVFIVNKKAKGCLKEHVLEDCSYLLYGKCWKCRSPLCSTMCLIGDNKRGTADARPAQFPRCLGDTR